MLLTKCKLTLLLVCCAFFCFTSCQKDSLLELDTLTSMRPLTIKTEACFSPTCMSLIVGYLDEDGLFVEFDDRKYHMVWHKNNRQLQNQKHRLDCTESGEYLVQVFCPELNIAQDLTYTLNLESKF